MKKLSIIFIFLSVFTLGIFAQEAIIEQMYEKAERIYQNYSFNEDMSWVMSLVVEKPGEPVTAYQYKVFTRNSKNQFCIVLMAPEAQKGQGYLQENDNIWFYDPNTHQFTHTSLKANISNSDVKADDVKKKDSFKDMYKIEKVEEGKLGKFAVYIVTVKAFDKDISYPIQKFYFRKDADLILKIEDFGASGKHMRTTLIPKYVKVGKSMLPIQQIYINELVKGEKTTTILSDFDTSKIPDVVFTKAYLEKIN